MTRRRSSAPGLDRPARHRSPSSLLLVAATFVIGAVLLVACDGAVESPSPTDAAPTASDLAPVTGDESATTGLESVPPSAEPTDSLEPTDPAESAEPTEPAETPAAAAVDDASNAPSGVADGSDATAAACAGNDDNREFYASVADAMGWTVYCPVLPSGWFVDSGSYRLAGGGHMEIGYKGPSGKRIELRQGTFCDDAAGCVPAGKDAGDASFGDRTGSLVATGDGRWAIVVDRGEAPSWLLVGSGLDETAFRKIAGDLVAVGR